LAALLLATAAAGWGCGAADVPPPQAIVSPMVGYMRPAKAPDCPMPVLQTMPDAGHKQIAILDAWGDLSAKDSDLLGILKRKACGVGADAMVITSEHAQDQGDLLPGWAPGPHTTLGGEQAGANVSEREHAPQVGEEGHGGRYMSAIAIVYTTGQNAQSTASGAN
jgi:hypothetical protein